jgi:hypothetical protein
MQRATPDVLDFETGPANRPTLRVQPSEEFQVQTQLNRDPWLDTHPDGPAFGPSCAAETLPTAVLSSRGPSPAWSLPSTSARSRSTRSALPGSREAMARCPAGSAARGVGPQHRIVAIRDGRIDWGDGRSLPVAPMLGFVGTSPVYETWSNG